MERQKMQKKPVSLAWKILVGMPFLAAAHIGIYYAALPAKIASHFGTDGQANDYMSKSSFALFYIGTVLFQTVIFAGMGWLLRVLPDDSMNIPNRDYWLAPERKEATWERFAAQMHVFGIATTTFLFAVIHNVILANLNGSLKLGSLFVVYLVLFLLFTVVWTVQMMRQWNLPKE
jgi:uncharacterized membrane protein